MYDMWEEQTIFFPVHKCIYVLYAPSKYFPFLTYCTTSFFILYTVISTWLPNPNQFLLAPRRSCYRHYPAAYYKPFLNSSFSIWWFVFVCHYLVLLVIWWLVTTILDNRFSCATFFTHKLLHTQVEIATEIIVNI